MCKLCDKMATFVPIDNNDETLVQVFFSVDNNEGVPEAYLISVVPDPNDSSRYLDVKYRIFFCPICGRELTNDYLNKQLEDFYHELVTNCDVNLTNEKI